MPFFRFLPFLIPVLALMAPLPSRAQVAALPAESVTSHPGSPEKGDAAPNAEAFDALLEQIGSHGDEENVGDVSYQRNRPRLAALLPPGDAVRAERLSAFDCYQFVVPSEQMLLLAEAGIARSEGSTRTAQMEYMLCKAYALYSLGRPYTVPLDALLKLADAETYPRLRAAALLLRSFDEVDTGHYAKTLETQREALTLDINRGALRSARLSNILIADTFSEMGLYESAEEILHVAVNEARARDDQERVATALEKLAIVQERTGNTDAALASLEECARIEKAQNGGDSFASVLLRIAQIHADKEDLERASQLAVQARELMVQSGSTDLLGARLGFLEATIAFAGDNPTRATVLLQGAIQRWRMDKALLPLVRALDLQARIDRSMNRWQSALDAREEQMRIRQDLDTRMQREQARFLAAELDSGRRKLENARLQQTADLQAGELRATQSQQRLRLAVIVLLGLLLAAMAVTLALTRKRLRGARRDAMTDSLTGIASRRQILRALSQAVQYKLASAQPLSVLAIDIDHFKQINDIHGHAAGDAVLRRVSDACRHALRQADPFGRTGGEEFLALLPGTEIDAAIQLAQRIRETVAEMPLGDIAANLSATISIGVAEAAIGHESADHLLARADAALYQAKRNGRNKVEVAPTSSGAPTIPVSSNRDAHNPDSPRHTTGTDNRLNIRDSDVPALIGGVLNGAPRRDEP